MSLRGFMYADVAMPIPLDRTLTYRIPEGECAEPGMRVAAPLGPRVLTGVVVGVSGRPAEPERRIRTLVKILDDAPALSAELLSLGRWMADYYRCSWGESLAVMLPALYRPVGRDVIRRISPAPGEPPAGKHAAQLLERLEAGALPRRELLRGLPAGAARVLAELLTLGFVSVETKIPRRRAPRNEETAAEGTGSVLSLTAHQGAALDAVRRALDAGRYEGFLLHGVTGSGKTEVYLRSIAHALEGGRGAILLVPEISLTPQTCARVEARFGSQVAVLHSRLSAGERAQAWSRLRDGQARIALGARSAVFAPVQNLGLIVIDEEPEPSYKQDDAPRYHARDVAAVRARAAGAVLVMGSATPSVDSFHNVRRGRYRLLELPARVDHKQLPEVRLIDLNRETDENGRTPVFSRALLEELEVRLRQGEQSILFLNRRGYAPVVMCPNCRHVLTCPDCSLSLVYHQEGDALRCHACGRSLPARPACPRCGTACVRLAGAGTQRVEEELHRFFPQARILRVDQDSTRRRGLLEQALARFGTGGADILLGTQMVAKGIDFPGVTLVGIISADTALHLPDFRAEERTFQLLVQVAGRAGRGGLPGLVLVQTLNGEHPVMALAQKHDYAGFFEREIRQREELGYPPFARLAGVMCRSEHAGRARQAAECISRRLRAAAGPRDRVLGPAPAPRERIAREQRFLVLLKSETVAARARLLSVLPKLTLPAGVKCTVDVDPQDLL